MEISVVQSFWTTAQDAHFNCHVSSIYVLASHTHSMTLHSESNIMAESVAMDTDGHHQPHSMTLQMCDKLLPATIQFDTRA